MSIFRVFVDGQLFYHPQLSALAITQAQVQEDAENIDSLTLSAPYSHPYLSFIKPLASTIICKKDDKIVFEGRALDDGSDFYNTHTWTCESCLAYLKDTLQPPYDYQGTLRGLLVYFISEHNKTVEDTNSSLVSYTKLSPNHSGQRTHSIDRITPHCVVGQLTAESICGCFTSTSRQASCNYGIGTDGKVALCVEEKNRSWCSSSSSNDQRAVTIECASDKTEPYAMNSKVYNSLVKLCTDICKRNGKKKLLWLGDKDKTLNYSPKSDEMVLTVHRWFANKSCPGNWLYAKLGDLATEVTTALGTETGTSTSTKSESTSSSITYKVKVSISDLNIRKGPGTNYAKTGKYTGKGTFTIVETKSGKGSTAGWGKLKSGAGWISLDYAKKL